MLVVSLSGYVLVLEVDVSEWCIIAKQWICMFSAFKIKGCVARVTKQWKLRSWVVYILYAIFHVWL